MLPHPARGVNAFVAFVARAGLDECVSCDAQRCTPATSPVYGFGMPPRKKPADPTLAVAYLRVSTDDQKLGPEIQRDQIGRWAAANGVTVLSWHFDEGVSGGTAIEKRPALMAALEAMRQDGAGLFIVAKRDRLARDTLNAGMIDRWAEKLGGRTVSADGTANGDTPADVMMRGMTDVFAQYERAIIRGRVKAAMQRKRSQGEFVGTAPWGARLSEDGVRLVPDEGEQAVVERARALRSQGVSYGRIVATLASEGVVARSGRPLIATQVVRMLGGGKR